ncbi:hypothetical protein [Quadrisphaera setariae]|uniref:PknH-like extracellular domain-containing protein n=1 Tax=Quadrisphaera setariae TaxID=2593304 RepID=A0A5C8ZEU4_9ACTN|nr:hypothetical protein [Quadrisphaera setariae]TXR56575.1 hypothetical protein FMM08_07230 [Quadrisphaera setariae]
MNTDDRVPSDQPVQDLDRDDDARGARSGAAAPSSSFEAGLREALRGVDGESGARPLDLEEVRRRGARRRPARAPGAQGVPVLAGVIAAACAAGIVAVTVSALPPSAPVGGSAVTVQPTATVVPTAGPPLVTPTPTLTGIGPTGLPDSTPTAVPGSEQGLQAPSATVVPLSPGQTFPARDTPGWNPFAVAYEIPDVATAASTAAALPPGVQLGQDLGQYRLEPTVPGQFCDGADVDTVAGRQWSWAEDPQSNDLTQVSVTMVVTGWPTGGGARAFRDAVEDTGACRWMSDPTSLGAASVPGADEAWAASFADGGGDSTRGAARVGDLVVGVEVWNPPSRSTAEVQRLLAASAAALAASGLPAASGR